MKATESIDRRLAVILSHPTQYYSPWFRWLSKNTPIKFRVFYLWEFGITTQRDPEFGARFKWDVDLLAGYDSEIVPNISARPGADHFFGFRNPSLAKRLSAYGPHSVLIFGYKWESHMRAIGWARRSGVPILFRGDSHLIGRPSPRLYVRLALTLLFSQFSSFLYVGAANREYFKAFGVPDKKLFFAPHSVDQTLFDRGKSETLAAAQQLRTKLGFTPLTKVVLFAGKLIPAKQPMELLEAFIADNATNTALVFVGEGPEKDRLMQYASSSCRESRVQFLPFANQTEMPVRYLASDLFVLPSRGYYETWGLAVNEAMHMGVPCLVSNRVGCQRDLVTHGETGWVFDPASPSDLRLRLGEALAALGRKDESDRIRSAVECRIRGYTYQQCSDGLAAALSSLTEEDFPIHRDQIN